LLAAAAALSLFVITVAGCETTPPTDEVGHRAVERDRERDRQREQSLAAVRDTEVTELTASEAAKRIELEPAIDDPLIEREIMLYEALYHAAYTSNIGSFTEHYLLDPPDDSPEYWYPEGVEIEERELLLRVLARLDRLQVPVRWTPADAPRALTEPVHFPGTRHLATRLGVRILERTGDDGEDPPTVRARLTDATAHVGGTRQNVTAVWDGDGWNIRRDPAFLVW
jgi:hypothetical protein